MTTSHVLWVTQHDLLTHDAYLTNDGVGDVEIRSLCGLSSNPHWESLIDADTEVTCPRCRALSAVEALALAA
jgi:hypothetical protein